MLPSSSLLRTQLRGTGRRAPLALALALVAVVAMTGCSEQPQPRTVADGDASSHWMEKVQDRWAGQPGELGSGAGTSDGSSRLSLGASDDGERTRIRVSVTCQGHGTVPMAVWNGRIADGKATGKRLVTRVVRCGHDEDLYVVTSSGWITIGPTAGDSSVGWYAAAYSGGAAGTS